LQTSEFPTEIPRSQKSQLTIHHNVTNNQNHLCGMKNLNLFLTVLIGLTILSCSSDNNSTDGLNTEKKLTQILHDGEIYENIVYDNSGKILERYTKNYFGYNINVSYAYNSSNKLTKYEYKSARFDHNSKRIYNISYNSDNKISNIEDIIIYYYSDGRVQSQDTINNNFAYSNNLIVRISDGWWNTKVEYGLNNDLITSIKVFKSDVLKSDMLFNYDSDGNCISGTGSINEGSLNNTTDTDNIELNVTYGVKEKNPFFNMSFDFRILTFTSFYGIINALIKRQGNKYAEIIKWYNDGNDTYKETYDNSFDSDGYITSQKISRLPAYPNYLTVSYTWE
jgi:hypothetical protein